MKRLIILLCLILAACQENKPTEDADQVLDPCEGAVPDEAILKIKESNKAFVSDDYTGVISSKFPYDTTTTQFLLYYENGDIVNYESFYYNGNLKLVKPLLCYAANGELEYYFEDGNISYTLEMDLGKKHGEAVQYYPNGEVQKLRYFTNDTLDGYAYEFSESGDTLLVEYYEMGKKIRQP